MLTRDLFVVANFRVTEERVILHQQQQKWDGGRRSYCVSDWQRIGNVQGWLRLWRSATCSVPVHRRSTTTRGKL